MVFISHYRDHVQAALAYNRTDQFKHEIKLRPHVERIIFSPLRRLLYPSTSLPSSPKPLLMQHTHDWCQIKRRSVLAQR